MASVVDRLKEYTIGDVIRLKGGAHLKNMFKEHPEKLHDYIVTLEELSADKTILSVNFWDYFVTETESGVTLKNPFEAISGLYKHRQNGAVINIPSDVVEVIKESRVQVALSDLAQTRRAIREQVNRIEESQRRIASCRSVILELEEKYNEYEEASQVDFGAKLKAGLNIGQFYDFVFEGRTLFLFDKFPIIMTADYGGLGSKQYDMGRFCYKFQDMKFKKVYPFVGNRSSGRISVSISGGIDSDGYFHPHIADGDLCRGDAAYRIERAEMNLNVAEVMRLIRVVMSNYNPASPYMPIIKFRKDGDISNRYSSLIYAKNFGLFHKSWISSFGDDLGFNLYGESAVLDKERLKNVDKEWMTIQDFSAPLPVETESDYDVFEEAQ